MRFKTAPSSCPQCGTTHDAAGNPSADRPPQDGDLTVCIECGEILCFSGQKLRRLRHHEMKQLKLSGHLDDLYRLQKIIREVG